MRPIDLFQRGALGELRKVFSWRLEEKQEARLNVWLDVWLCDDCESRAVLPRRVGDELREPLCCPNADCPAWYREAPAVVVQDGGRAARRELAKASTVAHRYSGLEPVTDAERAMIAEANTVRRPAAWPCNHCGMTLADLGDGKPHSCVCCQRCLTWAPAAATICGNCGSELDG